jgi:hypothetical protein
MSPFIHCVSFPSSSSIHNRQSGKITEAEALILYSALQFVSACVLLLMTASSQAEKLNEIHDSRN